MMTFLLTEERHDQIAPFQTRLGAGEGSGACKVRQGNLLRESCHERWSFGLRCYLLGMGLEMDLRALYKGDKVTNEQEKVKPREAPPSSCLPGVHR